MLEELRHGHLLQLGDVGLAALDLLVAVVDLRVAEDVLVLDVGILFGGKLGAEGGVLRPLGPGRRRELAVS